MEIDAWSAMSPEDQQATCQKLNPYENWQLFKDIESKFVAEFGAIPGFTGAFCGQGSSLGPINSITVSIATNTRGLKFPKHFLGFPVIKSKKTRKP